jgi:3-deoxy-D-manno-octulosonic-acid transferase
LALSNLLYDLFVGMMDTGLRIAAVFNNKARLGVQGRRNAFRQLPALSPANPRKVIWMHCASLGEFEQGRPLLERVKQSYPDAIACVSFFSASGYEAVKGYAGAQYLFYLPVDHPLNARKLVDALNPSLVLWVKYEFWHYYLKELFGRKIPVILVSGNFRPGMPFFRWYGGIWRRMLGFFSCLFVQNETSMELLKTIGIHDHVVISGDTRFDRVIEIAGKFEPVPGISEFCGNSRVIVAGSTWEDDEAELIHYVRANPQLKFIIAPHEINPENLKDVQKEFSHSIFYSGLVKTVGSGPVANLPNVLIIDNVGLLSRLYRYADIAYIGGGFGADGVHNVLEAAVFGKPVIYGPQFEKYVEAVALLDCGGAVSINNALELESVFNGLWENPEELAHRGEAARKYVYSNAGATAKIFDYIQEKRLLTS